MISLIMSDIVGDPLELISSGPTVIPEKSCSDPCVVLDQLGILDRVPARIVDILKSAYSDKIKGGIHIHILSKNHFCSDP